MKERLASVGRTSSLHSGLENGRRNVGSPPDTPHCRCARTLGPWVQPEPHRPVCGRGAARTSLPSLSLPTGATDGLHSRVLRVPPFTLGSLDFPPWKTGTENTDPAWVSATDPPVQGAGLWEGPASPGG